jgi:rod shape-determining protein MreD
VRSFILGPLLRLVPVGMVLLAVQRAVLSELRVGGVVVQIVLALAVATGAGSGPERGAVAGFTLGLMFDLATGSPLGLTALCYALGGYVAGYAVTLTPTPPWWLSMIFTGIGAAIAELSLPIGHTLIGNEGWFTTRLFLVVPVVAAFAMLLSPLFVPLGRWCMRFKPPKWRARPETT